MSFWDLTKPEKPVGFFDINSTRRIQIDWSEWLATEDTDYLDHELIVDEPLEVVSTTYINGVVIIYIRVLAGETAVLNKKYNIVCRLYTADGQIEDQTVILKATHK
jgi:hypothetical protein